MTLSAYGAERHGLRWFREELAKDGVDPKTVELIALNTVKYIDKYGATCWRLHDTVIAVEFKNRLTLYTGGYRTPTTKDRLNNYVLRGRASFSIYTKSRTWYIESTAVGGPRWVFADGIVLYRNGRVTGAPNEPAHDRKRIAMDKRINAFLKLVRQKLTTEEWPMPSNGDCVWCSLSEVNTGLSVGDTFHDHDHLLSHVKEKYIHGSLLWRAVQSKGFKGERLNTRIAIAHAQKDVRFMVDCLAKYLRKSLVDTL
jgi:hypothetical protein